MPPPKLSCRATIEDELSMILSGSPLLTDLQLRNRTCLLMVGCRFGIVQFSKLMSMKPLHETDVAPVPGIGLKVDVQEAAPDRQARIGGNCAARPAHVPRHDPCAAETLVVMDILVERVGVAIAQSPIKCDGRARDSHDLDVVEIGDVRRKASDLVATAHHHMPATGFDLRSIRSFLEGNDGGADSRRVQERAKALDARRVVLMIDRAAPADVQRAGLIDRVVGDVPQIRQGPRRVGRIISHREILQAGQPVVVRIVVLDAAPKYDRRSQALLTCSNLIGLDRRLNLCSAPPCSYCLLGAP